MKLRSKLLVAQFPNALALLLLGWLAVRSVTTLGRNSDLILRDNYRSVLAAQQMSEWIERIDSATNFEVMGRHQLAADQAGAHRRLFEKDLEIALNNITEQGETEAARDLSLRWKEYTAALDIFMDEGAATGAERYFQDLEPRFRRVKTAIQRILEINQEAMIHRSEQAKVAADRINRWITMVAVLALLVGVMGSLTFTGRLLRPLDSLLLAVRRVADQDLEMRAAVLEADEIGELATEFNRMAERLDASSRTATGRFMRAQQMARSAIDSIPYPVFTLTVDRRHLDSNRIAQESFHLDQIPASEDLLERLDPGVREAVERTHQHVIQGKGRYVPQGFEEAIPVQGAEGQRFLVPHGMPLYGEDGSVIGVTIVLLDVTQLRRLDELRGDLVATVAHEFRTPLTSLHMAIHLCVEEKAGPLTEKQVELLFAAREDCERLQGLVDDLLNLARLQAGEQAIQSSMVSPHVVLEDAALAHQTLAGSRGITLVVEVPAMIPYVLADPDSIRRVLANLVGNALRHTPDAGKVTLRAQLFPECVRFEVEDTGPGIAPEHRERVFERFFRVPDPGGIDRGSGLGLAIARELVGRNAGTIGVESEPGKGSVFWFTLPLAATDAADPEA